MRILRNIIDVPAKLNAQHHEDGHGGVGVSTAGSGGGESGVGGHGMRISGERRGGFEGHG